MRAHRNHGVAARLSRTYHLQSRTYSARSSGPASRRSLAARAERRRLASVRRALMGFTEVLGLKQKSPPRPKPGGQEGGGRHYGLIR